MQAINNAAEVQILSLQPILIHQFWPTSFGQPVLANQFWPTNFGQPVLANQFWPPASR
jgi:hypothetical protein